MEILAPPSHCLIFSLYPGYDLQGGHAQGEKATPRQGVGAGGCLGQQRSGHGFRQNCGTYSKVNLDEQLRSLHHLGEFPIVSYLKVKDSTKSLGTFLILVRGIFRQHAASIYGFVRFVSFVLFVEEKKIQATSKQGGRLRFGMLTVLTNIRSTKLLHHASCIMHHASQVTSKQGRRLRFGMLTVLRNIRSPKVLHHVSCIMHYALCIMHHASCIMHHATSKQGRRLKFGMLTVLTNIR